MDDKIIVANETVVEEQETVTAVTTEEETTSVVLPDDVTPTVIEIPDDGNEGIGKAIAVGVGLVGGGVFLTYKGIKKAKKHFDECVSGEKKAKTKLGRRIVAMAQANKAVSEELKAEKEQKQETTENDSNSEVTEACKEAAEVIKKVTKTKRSK